MNWVNVCNNIFYLINCFQATDGASAMHHYRLMLEKIIFSANIWACSSYKENPRGTFLLKSYSVNWHNWDGLENMVYVSSALFNYASVVTCDIYHVGTISSDYRSLQVYPEHLICSFQRRRGDKNRLQINIRKEDVSFHSRPNEKPFQDCAGGGRP